MGLRILLLTTDAYGGHGGIAYYNRCLAEAMAAMPEVAEVVVVPRVQRFLTTAIPNKINFLSSAAGGKLRYLHAVATLMPNNFDLIICGHINLLPLAAPLARLKSIPLVLQVHGIDVWKAPPKFVSAWLRYTSVVWSVSAVTRDRMNAWAKISPEKYTIIPNTIHLDHYGLLPQKSDLIKRHHLSNRKVIMTLARLDSSDRYKGIDEILEVMPALLQTDPTLVYLVLGDGDDQNRLQTKAASLGLSDNVIFAGYIQEQEKADYLRIADVFVLPGRGEGFGIVYLEALACGVPAVGSLLDGSREALRGGELGELVDPTQPESIVSGIQNALKKPRGIPPGLSYFGWPRFQARVAAAVTALLPAPSQPGHPTR